MRTLNRSGRTPPPHPDPGVGSLGGVVVVALAVTMIVVIVIVIVPTVNSTLNSFLLGYFYTLYFSMLVIVTGTFYIRWYLNGQWMPIGIVI